MDSTKFNTLVEGTTYELPKYKVTPAGLEETGEVQRIDFVRGSKDKEEDVLPNEGILHESLLAMQIDDLKHKQQLVPSTETKVAIKSLEQALAMLQSRQQRRQDEGTAGTYKT